MPTNSPELSEDILEGGITDSNCPGTADGGISVVDRKAFPVLHNLPETFGRLFCRVAGYLSRNDIPSDIQDHISLLPTVVLIKLTKILDIEAGGGHLIDSKR